MRAEDQPRVAIVAWILRVSLRQTVTRLTPNQQGFRTYAIGTVAALMWSVGAVTLLGHSLPRVTGASLEPYFVFPIVGTALATALVTVVTSCSLVDGERIVAALRPLPVSDHIIGAGLAAVTLSILALSGVILAPAVSVLISTTTGFPIAYAASWTAIALVTGLVVGMIIAIAARRTIERLRGSRVLLYPLSLALSCLVIGACLWSLGTRAKSPRAWITFLPMLRQAVVEQNTVRAAGLLLVASTAALLVGPLYSKTLGAPLRPPASARTLLKWSAAGHCPIVRLELTRLTRLPRFIGSLAAVSVVLLGAGTWIARTGAAERTDVTSGLCTIVAVVAAQPFMILRGHSPRSAPPQVILSGTPGRWLGSLLLACATMMALPTGTFWIINAVYLHQGGLSVFFCGVLAAAVGAGFLVGELMQVGPNNSFGEVVGLLAVSSFVYGGLIGAGKTIRTPTGLGLVATFAGVTGVAVAILIEHRRWRQLVGQPKLEVHWNGLD